MATHLRKRPTKKLRNRLEVQDRFRINLESIIRKYDKPFEDSPVLNLDDMSAPDLDSLGNFYAFGTTKLATDLKEGKQRKGGVSSDSALGSLPKSADASSTSSLEDEEEEDEEDDDDERGLYLQDFDFTHEESDALGDFIRYRRITRSGQSAIAGRENYPVIASSEANDDVESVCSGPTRTPMKKAKQACGNAGEDIVVEERRGTLGGEALCGLKDIKQELVGERKAAVEKVSYWLKSTPSAASGIAKGDEDTRMKESSFSELETEERDRMFSPGERSPLLGREYPRRGCDETTSLLELRDRFVRKVHSILVEGNNETDDMSSSADEMDSTTSAVSRTEGKGQRNSLQQGISPCTVKRNLSETHPESIKDRTCLKAQNHEEFVMQKGDESTILAGHFDDDYQQSPVKKEAVGLAKNEGKYIELVQNPTGKVEWTVGGTEGSTGQHEIPISAYPQECRAVPRGTAGSAHATPEKIAAFGMNARRSPTRSVQGCGKRLEASKKPQTMVETPVKDSSKDILNNIVDFFKAPLPQLLSSPMPVLSPMAKLRTAQGRKICGPSFKEEKVKEASPCPAVFTNLAPSQDCHSRGNQTAKEIMVNNTQSSVNHMQNGEVTNSSSGANKTKSQVKENKVEFKYPQRPKTVDRSTSSTETSDDNVFLLQEGCSSSSSMQDDKSRACSVDACGNIEATKVIRDKHFVKVSRSPMISSPFGHMTLSSDRKVCPESSDTQETKVDCRSPVRSSRGLVFDGCGHTSKDRGNSSDSMEILEFSSSDDIGDSSEESLNLLEETASSSENRTAIPQKVQNVRFTSGEAYSQKKCWKISDLVIPKQREKDYVSPAKANGSNDDKKVPASYHTKSQRHESLTETVRKNNQSGINSDTFIVAPRKSLDVYSRFCGKNNKQISPCKPRLEHSQTVEKRVGSPSCGTVRERHSSPLRVPESSASKIRSDHYQKKATSNDKPLACCDAGKKPMEGVKLKRSSLVHLVSPRVPSRSKPLAKTSSLASAKCAKTNVSFLSSTRLDEDPAASDSIGGESLDGKVIADPNVDGKEKVLRGTQIGHKGTPQKSSSRGENLCSVPQSIQSPSRLPVRSGGISQRQSHVEVPRGAGSSPLRMSRTPSKRLRPGCDRASLESPAKKRTPDRPVTLGARDPRLSYRATSRGSGSVLKKKSSAHVPGSRDEDFRGFAGSRGGSRSGGGNLFQKSAPSSRPASRAREDASMMSSMCEGKGKCNKTVCFTCAVNDA